MPSLKSAYKVAKAHGTGFAALVRDEVASRVTV